MIFAFVHCYASPSPVCLGGFLIVPSLFSFISFIFPSPPPPLLVVRLSGFIRLLSKDHVVTGQRTTMTQVVTSPSPGGTYRDFSVISRYPALFAAMYSRPEMCCCVTSYHAVPCHDPLVVTLPSLMLTVFSQQTSFRTQILVSHRPSTVPMY